jgi:hypothetical protein
VPSEPEFDPLPLIEALSGADVDFVVIGGVAGGAHGSAYGTSDLDIAYARDRANLERLARVLRELGATPAELQRASRFSWTRKRSRLARTPRS